MAARDGDGDGEQRNALLSESPVAAQPDAVEVVTIDWDPPPREVAVVAPPTIHPEAVAFVTYLELRKEARRRNCRPAVVMHPELLTATRCSQCNRLEDLGPARPAMTATQDGADPWVHNSRFPGPPESPAPASAATLPVLEGVAGQSQPALDVVAMRGACFECAKEIYEKTARLQRAVNVNGDTPLHCAARTGNMRMVCHLITLAGEEGDGHDAAVAALRRHNGRGETALHEAVRSGNKDMAALLMWVDRELARVPADGTSPLYLAVSSGREDMARLLNSESRGNLSYSGPDGQNALHAAAVLRSEVMTRMLLDWNEDLTKQEDRSGSTPLHFAASARTFLIGAGLTRTGFWDSTMDMFCFSRLRGPFRILLDADRSSAYLPDNKGLFPIHVAASTGKIKALHILIAKCPDSAGSRDAKGRTFLHVAAEKKRHKVVKFACQEPRLAWILNTTDNEGNTAMHLAVQLGDWWSFCYLMQNQQVRLDIRNNNELTPLDVSCCGKTTGLSYGMDPRISIHRMLIYADAHHGTYRWDQFEEEHIPKLDEEKEAKKLTESTQALGIGAVLVATTTFAAAFTMPGGYRADDHTNGGAPTRAGNYAFDAFIVSNTLAFTLSCLATTLLVLSGAAVADMRTRLDSLGFSVAFLVSAARSFCVAFALGVYVVLAPVARATAIAACVITSFTLLDLTLFVRVIFNEAKALHCRLGSGAWWRLGKMIIVNLMGDFWSYIIIFGLPPFLKILRNR